MRTRDYDTMYKETSGGTETHTATDEMIRRNSDQPGLHRQAFEEGFASASGVRGETAETGGRITHPEQFDRSLPERDAPEVEEENAGLADG